MCRRKLIFSSSLLCWLVIKRELLVAKHSFSIWPANEKDIKNVLWHPAWNQPAPQPHTCVTCIHAHKDKYLAFRFLLRVRHITFYIPSTFLKSRVVKSPLKKRKSNLTQLENKQWASKSLVSEIQWQHHCLCFLSTVTVISDVWWVKSVEEQNPSLPIIYVSEKKKEKQT